MKALASPESHLPRSMRRVSKPVMEKRRRERINHSLETLRLLMLDKTHDEKLKNPKVEKAEILESVVDFLKTEKDLEKGQRATKRVLSREQRTSCARQQQQQHSYREGMNSCLLRISHFIASKSQQEPEEGVGATSAYAALPEPSPGHIHHNKALKPTGDSAALSPQHPSHHHHPHLTQGSELPRDSRTLLSPRAACKNISDQVWRPWP